MRRGSKPVKVVRGYLGSGVAFLRLLATATGCPDPRCARLTSAHRWTLQGGRKHVSARVHATSLSGPVNGAVPRPATPAAAQEGTDADDGHARIRGVIDGAAEPDSDRSCG